EIGAATTAAPAAATPAGSADDKTAVIVDRSTLTEAPLAGMSTDDFIGTTVYGAKDENVGEIDDVILGADGKAVEAVVLDVGGFLGIGSKKVAVGMENLTFMTDADGDTYLYT